MMRTQAIIVLWAVITNAAYGLELKATNKLQPIRFRIAAVTEHSMKSGFSANSEIYLAYKVGTTEKHQGSPAVKIVFRFMGYEDGLSTDFADFNLIHTFKAQRKRSCDETWQSVRTKQVGGKDGLLETVVISHFVSAEATLDIPHDQVLPCYVISSQGYTRSESVRANEKPRASYGE